MPRTETLAGKAGALLEKAGLTGQPGWGASGEGLFCTTGPPFLAPPFKQNLP